jgi:hypothetical protein
MEKELNVMNLDELYTEYGKLQIHAEILQNRILEVKRGIAEQINRPVKPDTGKDDKPGVAGK